MNDLIFEVVVSAIAVVMGVTAYYLRTPDIEKGDGWLCIKHSTLFQVLSLGLFFRRVRIDKPIRTVTIDTRFGWVVTRHTVLHTDELDHIEFRGGRDRRGKYTILLVGKDEREHEMYTFANSVPSRPGEAVDDNVGYGGTVGEEARELLKDIEWFTGLKTASLMLRSEKALMAECPHCGRVVSKYGRKCLYCGGPLEGDR
ncbi:MAG: hypothetical protein FJZ95_07680 [Chloroflexi bacterium]|nr:hypothetical protein [Chloroflexota bacterium]